MSYASGFESTSSVNKLFFSYPYFVTKIISRNHYCNTYLQLNSLLHVIANVIFHLFFVCAEIAHMKVIFFNVPSHLQTQRKGKYIFGFVYRFNTGATELLISILLSLNSYSRKLLSRI